MRRAIVPALSCLAAAACIVALIASKPAVAQVAVSSSASFEEYEYEWLPGTDSTTYRGSPPAGARAFYAQNRSTATVYIRFDAQAVTTAGATGYKLAPGDSLSFDIDSSFATKLRAGATAATSTGAGVFTSWWR